MKKLKIRFWRIENVVIMKILDQDERLRGCREIFRNDYLDMAIYLSDYSALYTNSISIKEDIDNMACSRTFNSIEDATVYIKKCQELIYGYNARFEEGEEEEEVETIETFTF